jgi:hypothetical protein
MTQLICKKCRTPLTKPGLYKVSSRRINLRPSEYKKQRSFLSRWSRWFGGYAATNKAALLDQEQVKFIEGWGCCGNSSKEILCSCGLEVGVQKLDCYEDKTLRFDLDKVEECYFNS